MVCNPCTIILKCGRLTGPRPSAPWSHTSELPPPHQVSVETSLGSIPRRKSVNTPFKAVAELAKTDDCITESVERHGVDHDDNRF